MAFATPAPRSRHAPSPLPGSLPSRQPADNCDHLFSLGTRDGGGSSSRNGGARTDAVVAALSFARRRRF